MSCCICIEESNVGMIESFGKFSRVAEPGINFMNCLTERVAGQLSLRVEQQTINVETRSKDNVFVTIRMAVQYKVAENETEFPNKLGTFVTDNNTGRGRSKKQTDEEQLIEKEAILADGPINCNLDGRVLYSAYYKLNKPIEQILAYLEEFFRFHGMEYTLDEMFAAKNDMTHELQNMLNERMNPYGYIIKNILVIDIDPDIKVKRAMNDIIASEKEKRAQQSRAEAEKITKILAAEAEAKTRELAGEGIANARKAIVSGLQHSVDHFQHAVPGTDPNQIMMTVLMTQYMDTIKEVSSRGSNTFIMPSSPAQVTAMEEQLRIAMSSSKSIKGENKKDI